MQQLSCLALVFCGALLIAWSIVCYIKMLHLMQKQNDRQQLFKSPIYRISLGMMILFILGYTLVGISLLYNSFHPYYAAVSAVFFIGGVFTLCMVQVQKEMTENSIDQTLGTLHSMIAAMEAKDPYTKGHSVHVCALVDLIYHELPVQQRKMVNLDKIKDAALLHDIGKIGVDERILNKPSTLTEEEFEQVRQHAKMGQMILAGSCFDDLALWVLYHHERMDGKGYYRVPACEIPYESKIIALADTFSALYTDRVYRPRFEYEKAIEILRAAAGTQLEEQLVQLFCNIPKEKLDALHQEL